MSQQSFPRRGVSAPVVEALAARNITQPFDIQERALPDALSGLDVLVRSPTGSGKTLAFALPIGALARADPRTGGPGDGRDRPARAGTRALGRPRLRRRAAALAGKPGQ